MFLSSCPIVKIKNIPSYSVTHSAKIIERSILYSRLKNHQKPIKMENQEFYTISDLHDLIKQNKNADFKYIVSSVDQSHLVQIGGNTLMHTAAATSNIEVITFLYSSGFDINAQNEHGQTPLHVALCNCNFHSVQLLLSLESNILIPDGQGTSALEICFQAWQMPEYIIVCFLQRLKRTGLSAQQTTDELDKVGCTIREVLAMNDAEVTGLMLERTISIDNKLSRDLLERALTSGYPDNVRAVLQFGPGADKRLEIFLKTVMAHRFEPDMKFYIDQLANWDLITEDLISKAAFAFRGKTEKDIEMYLYIGVDEYTRKKFGWELLVGLFGNENVNCIEIIKNRDFNVNGLDIAGFSALHIAALNKNKEGMIYLLENGADPNIRDFQGKTPLFVCRDNELIDLLLESGADVQVVDCEGQTIIEENTSHRILVELCILEARESLTRHSSEAIRKKLDDGFVKSTFNNHRRDIEWMKTRYVSSSVSLFDVLVDRVECSARYLESDVDVATVEAMLHRKLSQVLVSLIRKNMEKAVIVNKLRPIVAAFLCNVMKVQQRDNLVIEKIVSFLRYRDLLVFDKIGFD